jgi:hypothetical protein
MMTGGVSGVQKEGTNCASACSNSGPPAMRVIAAPVSVSHHHRRKPGTACPVAARQPGRVLVGALKSTKEQTSMLGPGEDRVLEVGSNPKSSIPKDLNIPYRCSPSRLAVSNISPARCWMLDASASSSCIAPVSRGITLATSRTASRSSSIGGKVKCFAHRGSPVAAIWCAFLSGPSPPRCAFSLWSMVIRLLRTSSSAL